MGTLTEKVRLCSRKRCQEVEGLMDSGATMTFISNELAKRIKPKFTGMVKEVTTAEKRKGKPVKIKTKEALLDNFEILGCKRPGARVWVGDVSKDLIVGVDIMQELGLKLDMKRDKTVLERCEIKPLELI